MVLGLKVESGEWKGFELSLRYRKADENEDWKRLEPKPCYILLPPFDFACILVIHLHFCEGRSNQRRLFEIKFVVSFDFRDSFTSNAASCDVSNVYRMRQSLDSAQALLSTGGEIINQPIESTRPVLVSIPAHVLRGNFDTLLPIGTLWRDQNFLRKMTSLRAHTYQETSANCSNCVMMIQ
jgi:hypothetical protein